MVKCNQTRNQSGLLESIEAMSSNSEKENMPHLSNYQSQASSIQNIKVLDELNSASKGIKKDKRYKKSNPNSERQTPTKASREAEFTQLLPQDPISFF